LTIVLAWQDNDKKNILAVQSLRNTIMGSTLMASTAILMCAATATLMASAYFHTESPLFGGANQKLLCVKYMSVMLCFGFTFLCYMQSVRYINHANFLINIPLHSGDTGCPTFIRITPDYVSNVLAKGCNFFTVGTRSFYVAFPLLLWFFSPIPVLVTCVGLVPLLFYLDTADIDAEDGGFICKSNLQARVGVDIEDVAEGYPGVHDSVKMSPNPDHWSTVELRIRAAMHEDVGR
jgi:uncharacterized membrane protein